MDKVESTLEKKQRSLKLQILFFLLTAFFHERQDKFKKKNAY